MMTPERIAYLAQTMWNATVDAGHVAQSPTDPEKGARIIPWNALKDGAKAAIIAGTEILVETLAVEPSAEPDWSYGISGKLVYLKDENYHIHFAVDSIIPFRAWFSGNADLGSIELGGFNTLTQAKNFIIERVNDLVSFRQQ